METLNGLKRTHYCGDLRESNIGEEVVLMGWVQKKRNLGGLVFVDLRDRSGICQIIFDTDVNEEAFAKAEKLGSEYVIAIKGKVAERSSKNPNLPTGDIEVFATELKLLNKSETPPIYIKDDDNVSEELRLKYRYLDLRKPSMQKNLMLRSRVANIVRNYLSENNFFEIETPFLIKPTPEGARDYLVPSRVNEGKFYALPQSPQLFKQLLMVSGFDRYFQIVKCFRDEDLRANRQPEFTQVDLEMSFVEQDDVMALNEGLIKHVFKEVLGVDVKTPIKRMTFKDAMEKYGSDKPDLRFGMEITNLSDVVKECGFKVFTDAVANGGSVRGLCLEGGASMGRKDIDRLGEFVKTFKAKGLAWIQLKEEGVKSPIAKFFSEEELNKIIETMGAKTGDLILIVADKNSVVLKALGELRLELSRKFDLVKDKSEFNFTWITEFDLLEYDEEEGRYFAAHHPFTMPMDEDIKYLDTDPGRVRAKAYDLVLNGEELGGGSIRIHDTKLQEKMFEVLGFTQESAWERFGFLLEAFKFGPPPHGGLAFGLDRMIMFLAGTENIKDVITFPKNQNAFCYLTEAPNIVDEEQLKELGIETIKKEDTAE